MSVIGYHQAHSQAPYTAPLTFYKRQYKYSYNIILHEIPVLQLQQWWIDWTMICKL